MPSASKWPMGPVAVRIGAPVFILLGLITAIAVLAAAFIALGTPSAMRTWIPTGTIIAILGAAALARRPSRITQPRRARLIAAASVIGPAALTLVVLGFAIACGQTTGALLMAGVSAVNGAILVALGGWGLAHLER